MESAILLGLGVFITALLFGFIDGLHFPDALIVSAVVWQVWLSYRILECLKRKT